MKRHGPGMSRGAMLIAVFTGLRHGKRPSLRQKLHQAEGDL
jgi:hypothetical protein